MTARIVAALAALVLCGAALAQSNSALRDPKQAAAFKRTHACPATGKVQRACPGYVVDHIMPLCAGGADEPANMMWMSAADGKKKDAVEMKLCRCMGTAR